MISDSRNARVGMVPSAVVEAIGDPARIKNRAIDRVAYASDASHYLSTPHAVLVPRDAREVGAILRAAGRSGSRVTFRSGGTSLSGQATGDDLLIDTRQSFRGIDVLDGGRRVRVQPGATVRQVNARLLRHGYRLGPDPASETACTIGGVVANNSSGMACGITENTYRTLESLVFVLPSGTTVDTAEREADEHLRMAEPRLFEGLVRLQRRVRENSGSVRIIERQFGMKNTMGYGVNAFLDFDSPVDVLAHLIVGSEGTLAFVAEATFRTVPLLGQHATALAVLPNLDAATRLVPELVATGAAMVELMDATSIRVGQSIADAPAQILGFPVAMETALLIEYQAQNADELAALTGAGQALLDEQPLRAPAVLSTSAADRARAWKLRKGLYASVAGARPPGTTALLEDIVVPVPSLAATCEGLQALFERRGYGDSVIFGHAKDGNLHFMLTDTFRGDDAMDRFAVFTDEMVALVLAAGGNLKAEHGTGRAMAPYVRRQYGDELYEVMCELKRLCDPSGILNPGVIIGDDPAAHLKGFKHQEPIEAEADRCVECGYCEPVCPSKDLTLTPRQRIVVRRGMERASASGDHDLARELRREYDYDGVETCAADGMCATACPVLIDTGSLVKRLREEGRNPLLATAWKAAAKGWGPVSRSGAHALTVADSLPAGLVQATTALGRSIAGDDVVPAYSPDLPPGGRARRRLTGVIGGGDQHPAAVYIPACVNGMFGPAPGGVGATSAFVELLARAGVRVIVPEGIEALCCGTPWASKGYRGGRDVMARRVVAAVREASDDGRLPVLSDASSCTEGFAKLFADAGLDSRVEDAVAFVAREILPRFGLIQPRIDTLALHPTCSSTQLGLNPALESIARAVARNVVVPDSWGCCAFAGDRGMLHPELAASATALEAAEVLSLQADAHASCNRTCELGMSRATGEPYLHILELLEAATRSPR